MARFFVELTNENGKIVSLSGGKVIDIAVRVGNQRLVTFKVQNDEEGNPIIYDQDENEIYTQD